MSFIAKLTWPVGTEAVRSKNLCSFFKSVGLPEGERSVKKDFPE